MNIKHIPSRDGALYGMPITKTVWNFEWVRNIIYVLLCMWLLIHAGIKGKPC